MIVLQVEFLLMLRSRRQKLSLRANDNQTYQKSWQIFWVKLIPSDLQSSHSGLLIQKIKASGSGFHVLANKTYDQVQCQMSITNKAEN